MRQQSRLFLVEEGELRKASQLAKRSFWINRVYTFANKGYGYDALDGHKPGIRKPAPKQYLGPSHPLPAYDIPLHLRQIKEELRAKAKQLHYLAMASFTKGGGFRQYRQA